MDQVETQERLPNGAPIVPIGSLMTKEQAQAELSRNQQFIAERIAYDVLDICRRYSFVKADGGQGKATDLLNRLQMWAKRSL